MCRNDCGQGGYKLDDFGYFSKKYSVTIQDVFKQCALLHKKYSIIDYLGDSMMIKRWVTIFFFALVLIGSPFHNGDLSTVKNEESQVTEVAWVANPSDDCPDTQCCRMSGTINGGFVSEGEICSDE